MIKLIFFFFCIFFLLDQFFKSLFNVRKQLFNIFHFNFYCSCFCSNYSFTRGMLNDTLLIHFKANCRRNEL